ncbi:hypothetical protein [Actinomadura sp. DC4]|uniref:hypothetical protein n=1 Tax=Actinomadura sp. DC4 TaxID=3055069 RepID=UPI0025B0B029|nr:hypothetical protein [Actinomadura sp. DC4]MDN3353120.1 hypothetical protein [Actinomadura sp. DC4]
MVLAFGLLIIGGIALWGALTSKDGEKPNAASPTPSSVSTKPKAPSSQIGNTVLIHCLSVQCAVFVSGPGATDVQFNGSLTQNERRIFNETQLTVAIQDNSTVTVTINGKLQPRAKTYQIP